MSRLTVGTKLGIAFGAMLLLTLVVGSVALWTSRSLADRLHTATTASLRKAELAGEIDSSTSDMLVYQRGMYLGAYKKDAAAVQEASAGFRKAAAKAKGSLQNIEPLLVTAEGKRIVGEIGETIERWERAFPELERLSLAGDGDGAAARGLATTFSLYQKLGADSDELASRIRALADNDRQAGESEAASAAIAIWVSLGLTVAVGAGVLYLIRSLVSELRRVTNDMSETADQVTSAASQVAASSQVLAQGASEQAASIEETSASSEELTSMTRKNTEHTQSAASLMSTVDQRIAEANRTLDQMVISMREINESSDKISRIIKVIDEIAFQTNILALNAAVEAARAGEAGMGFAVVADEVRNLAQRSAQAAKDTAELIEESISRSAEGKRKLEEVTSAIGGITQGAAEVKTLIDEVSVGSQEQARGIEQIGRAVAQMEQVTQNSAATAEESASASEELNAMAEAMRRTVTQLEGLVGRVESARRLSVHKDRHAEPAPPSRRTVAKTLH